MAESQSQAEGWNGMKKPLGVETGSISVLSVSHNDQDCTALRRIFKIQPDSGRRLQHCLDSIRAAGETDSNRNLRLRYLLRGVERDVRANLSFDPRSLIVTSWLADERLWAGSLKLAKVGRSGETV